MNEPKKTSCVCYDIENLTKRVKQLETLTTIQSIAIFIIGAGPWIIKLLS